MKTPSISIAAIVLTMTACQRPPERQQDSFPPEPDPAVEPVAVPLEEAAEAHPIDEEPSASAEPTPTALAQVDRDFVDTASRDGAVEVELGKLVLEKAKKSSVKDFAQKMVDQHTAANEELASLCKTRGIEMPAANQTAADEAAKAARAELEPLAAAKLEKTYAEKMVEDHRKAVELFRKQSTEGQDPELRAWAAKTLPTLEEHLTHAEHLAKGKAYKPMAHADTATSAPVAARR